MSENADSGDTVPLTELDGLRTANASLERVNRRQFDMLQALFLHSPAAISLQSVEDGRFVDVNIQWQRLTGYSWEQATSSTSLSLGFWPDIESRNRALAELEASGQVRAVGQARARRWVAAPLVGFTTILLLPTTQPNP